MPMQTIPLTKGYVAVVDGEDYEWLAAFKWTARETRKTVYAARYQRKHEYGDGKKRIVLMHRQIMGLDHDDARDVDHRNHDGLDNRKANLRTCDRSHNIGNMNGGRGASRYKGVHLYRLKSGPSWRATIKVNGVARHLGAFASEEDAARAYDRAAVEAFGEFAHTNF